MAYKAKKSTLGPGGQMEGPARQGPAAVASPVVHEDRAGHGPAAPTQPSIKIKIDLAPEMRLGPGKVRLLELVGSEGSVSRAAEAMGISYRRAWLFVQHVNQAFDLPAIVTPEHGHGGGPARLTPFGQELIARYREFEAEANRSAAATMQWMTAHARGTTPKS